MKYAGFILLFLFFVNGAIGQKEIGANRITESVTIDGHLDEIFWGTTEVATGFINWQPEAGVTPAYKTEVKLAYDDEAVYVGAYLEASSRDEVKTELTQRDDLGNTDWFGLILDTYGNGTEASEFIVGATGVQFDAKITTSSGEDRDWSEVWYSETRITDSGWYVEMKIPYSALRFPKVVDQNWRVNYMRKMADNGQKCSFQFIDPEVSGFANQTACLRGVSNIKSAIRLSFSPYITGYFQHNHSPDSDPANSTGYSYNGGLDVKYGINEAFTLDMTLIPDFGQVQSDDEVLNLSPFEVRYAENRAFFTEGLDLFRKANLFYTRRIGGTPLGYWDVADGNDEIIKNPGETQLYNATKVSGRTSSGLGVGIFNAIAGSTHAEIKLSDIDEPQIVETSPLTNYSIVVLDQNLANNSSISLINTNVWRKGDSFYNANVTGTEFNFRTKGQNWGVNGDFSLSQLIYRESDNVNGIRYNTQIGKISGAWRYSIGTSAVSPTYDNNDLGFNTITNVKEYDLSTRYNINEEWKGFSNAQFWGSIYSRFTYDTNDLNFIHFNGGFWGRTKGLWDLNLWTNYRPESKDYFEPQVEGRFLSRPGSYNLGTWLGSDDRNKLRVSGSVFGMKQFEEGAHIMEFSVGPRYRFNDKFSLYLSNNIERYTGQRGFADIFDDEPIIGKRNQLTIQNVMGASYTFNSKMSLNLRTRHYWSKVEYYEYFGLNQYGDLIPTTYNEPINFSFTQFNVDLNYTWRFAPGSDIVIVWKNWIFGDENSELIDYSERNYINGVKDLANLPQQNSLSVRLVYFLNGANFL